MAPSLSSEQLFAVIETQNEIAATALDLDAVMSLVARRARDLTGAAAAAIELAAGEEMVYHVGSGTARAHVGLRLRIDSSLSGLCVRLGTVLHCADAAEDDRVDYAACRAVGAVSMVCVPLTHADAVVGAIKVYDPEPHFFTPADVAILDLLSGVIAAHMSHATSFAAERHAGAHDALTGLPNRRAFDERLSAELGRAFRHGGTLALCVLDLDGFKAVNDTDGHAAGDAVLRAVAEQLLGIRDEDAAFRLGGDESALLLVGSGADGARAALDRLGAAIAVDPACGGVGVSSGIATLAAGDVPESLLSRADEALYAAKHALKSASSLL